MAADGGNNRQGLIWPRPLGLGEHPSGPEDTLVEGDVF